MRISNAAWAIVLTTSSIFTDAFTAPNSLSIQTRLAATIEREQTAEAPSSFQDVQKLGYRDLQRHCKSLGLEAVGSTAALRKRLLGHYGLLKESNFTMDEMTPQEVEVSSAVLLSFIAA
jgi:hypothetical protein